MTTLPDRPHTALLVIDVQVAVMAAAYECDAVIARIAALLSKAREADAPVIWVQHSDAELVSGTDGWRYVPELQPAGGEPVVAKQHGDAFEATELEELLAARGVGRLVLAGAETDACIRSTLHGAFTRGYDVTLVGDAHTTNDMSAWGAPDPAAVIAHTNLYWAHHSAPGRTADTVQADDVRVA